MKPPRKKASAIGKMLRPGKITAQWGDGPLLEFERQPPPFTDPTFWEACKTYFPPELHTPAAAFLLKLFKKAQRANAKAGKGRPSRGIGQQVHDLTTGPLGFDQATARRMVASPRCTCREGDDGPLAEPCRCGAYERVARLHLQWKSDRRKGKP